MVVMVFFRRALVYNIAMNFELNPGNVSCQQGLYSRDQKRQEGINLLVRETLLT